MLEETGTVIAVDPDGVWVETLQQSACGQCKAKHGCGQRMLASAESRLTCIKAMYAEDYLGRKPELGEQVVIGVDENALVKGALLSYGLPLSLMLLAVISTSLWTVSEWLILGSAVAGLLAGGFWVQRRAHAPANRLCLQAVLVSSDRVVAGERVLLKQ